MSYRHVVAVALLLTAMGCMRDPAIVAWEAEYVAADRICRDGGYEEALARYRDLRGRALNDADVRAIDEDIARTLVALGRGGDAIAVYERTAESAPDRETRARLLFRAARVYYDDPEQQEAGLALIIKLVDAFPDTTAGLRGLQYVREHFGGTRRGREWLLEFYRDRFQRLRATPLADNLVFGATQILVERGTREDDLEALRLLDGLTKEFRRSGHWDDAVWMRADIEHRLGMYQQELADLTELVQTREKPLFFGNYETKYFHRTQYRIANLLRNELEDDLGAIAAFEVFVREYPFSKSYDDALFQLVELYLRTGQKPQAEATSARLTRERPESRFAARARVLAATGRDPGPPPTWTDPTVPYEYPGEGP